MITLYSLDFKCSVQEVRRLYELTKDERQKLSRKLYERSRTSCILLVTCTRVEYYADGPHPMGVELLLRTLGLEVLKNKARVGIIEGRSVFSHLYRISLGIDSALYGEDTITSQITVAYEIALSSGTGSAMLNRLFLSAVAFSRQMRKTYEMRGFSDDIAPSLYSKLSGRRRVLVVGSGILARMIASYLAGKGLEVTITLRDEEKIFLCPVGVKSISYEKRYEALSSCEVLVSASSSLYYTFEEKDLSLMEGILLFDLAMPYDLPQSFKALRLEDLDYDDSSRLELERKLEVEIDSAVRTLEAHLDASRDALLAEELALELRRRMYSRVMKLSLTEEERTMLLEDIAETGRKVFVSQFVRNSK